MGGKYSDSSNQRKGPTSQGEKVNKEDEPSLNQKESEWSDERLYRRLKSPLSGENEEELLEIEGLV
jgi:hypothetical protein